MRRVLLAFCAVLALAGSAQASQAQCWTAIPNVYFSAAHTSGLASATLSYTTSGIGSDPMTYWCSKSEESDTVDGTLIQASATCFAVGSSSYRVISRDGLFRISSGAVVPVAVASAVKSVGSASLDGASLTLVASTVYVLPKVTGVASEELDWNCQIVATTFRAAVP